MNTSPTQQTYDELQRAYDHFNKTLFAGALPHCLVTLQREKRTYGYFSSKRFVHMDGSIDLPPVDVPIRSGSPGSRLLDGYVG